MPNKIEGRGICQIEGCQKKTSDNRKYCEMHRMRFIRTKRYDIFNKNPIEKLLNNIRKDQNDCWNYIASTNNEGYGYIRVNGKRTKAHRISYEHFVGPISDGAFVLHKCDNPACVNPDHLYVGTQLDNVKDMYIHGKKKNMHSRYNP
jgi:hypothetical protein